MKPDVHAIPHAIICHAIRVHPFAVFHAGPSSFVQAKSTLCSYPVSSHDKGGEGTMGFFGDDFSLVLVLFILLVIIACEC
ncbi:YjcZ family sporulation protein [Brevibacillus choshinensis]|uniref:YjcZ family sporulation protein n=2 Tax=Brevibacillus choshinensis TaxID=54911 RepID=A0ABX7FRL2_BRECH|nr:YjcZ family sporulation protein [Brevibacillus choshinensis]